MDKDFRELVVRDHNPVVGVVLLRLDGLTQAAKADRVSQALAPIMDRIVGSFVVIEVARVRIRPLPTTTD
jgi:hypothetical protein